MKTTVETYRLVTTTGRHIRMATRVTFADGLVVKFMDKMGNKEAIRQAELYRVREGK